MTSRRTVNRAPARVGRFGLGSVRAGGSILVLVSAVIVAGMVASLVGGPLGGRVLAQDGYGKRDRESGIVAALLGGAGREERPAFTGWQDRAPPRDGVVAASGWSKPPRSLHEGSARHSAPAERRAAFAESRAAVASQTVCVRLCDGYYFPMGAAHGPQDESRQAGLCNGLCPGAPTRLFVTRGGLDDIESATPVGGGRRYADLPVAFAHTRDVGPTCACHPAGRTAAGAVSPLKDFTLRSGDSIMTPVGWRVFQGAAHFPFQRRDFAPVRSAANLPARTRTMLARMEDVSLGRPPVAARLRPLVVTPKTHVAAADARAP